MKFESLSIGNLSATYAASEDALLVLAHGAGAGHDHPHMTAIAKALQHVGIGTLRYNFPFIEAGKRRVDTPSVCIATIAEALATAERLAGNVPLLIGGHSFGGRMSTHFAAERDADVAGVICFSFPLHPPKKPAVERAAHLPAIKTPQLFLSGDRDALAKPDLLRATLTPLPRATLHWLETADHSFKILKSTRKSSEDIYDEAGRVTSKWIRSAC